MAERRALKEGLNPVEEINRQLEEEFVYNPKPRKAAKPLAAALNPPLPSIEQPPGQPPTAASLPAAPPSQQSPLMGVGRTPVGARVRTDLATAFKRASLERQLHGIQPCSVQDLLEESMELWLLKHGYLK